MRPGNPLAVADGDACLSFRTANGGILSGLPDIRVNRRHRPSQDHLQPGGIVPGQQQQVSDAVPAAGQQQQRAIVGVPAAKLTATTSQRCCQGAMAAWLKLIMKVGWATAGAGNGGCWGGVRARGFRGVRAWVSAGCVPGFPRGACLGFRGVRPSSLAAPQPAGVLARSRRSKALSTRG